MNLLENYAEVESLRSLTTNWLTLTGMFLKGVSETLDLETVANLLRVAAHYLNVRNDRIQIVCCRLINESSRVASAKNWRQV